MGLPPAPLPHNVEDHPSHLRRREGRGEKKRLWEPQKLAFSLIKALLGGKRGDGKTANFPSSVGLLIIHPAFVDGGGGGGDCDGEVGPARPALVCKVHRLLPLLRAV